MPYEKDKIAELVRTGRLAKGYTQLELAERTRISLRSVQRIENGGVAPRLYTLKVLAGQLDFDPDSALLTKDPAAKLPGSGLNQKINRPRRWILSVGLGLVILIGCIAFLSQSRRFPETDFEALCFWGVVTLCYTCLLWRIWK
jgi:transcriptional regulator with XRE-family HTH domain